MQRIEIISFEEEAPHEWVYVYLHGAGEFGESRKSLYKYRDFPLLIKSKELIPAHPFMVFHAIEGDRWEVDSVEAHLKLVLKKYPKAKIHLIGFSRGGVGVYEYVSKYSLATKATVINSRVCRELNTRTNIDVVHAKNDQTSKIDEVRDFVKSKLQAGQPIRLTEFEGDHYSIAEIGLSGIVVRTINKHLQSDAQART